MLSSVLTKVKNGTLSFDQKLPCSNGPTASLSATSNARIVHPKDTNQSLAVAHIPSLLACMPDTSLMDCKCAPQGH